MALSRQKFSEFFEKRKKGKRLEGGATQWVDNKFCVSMAG